MVPAPQNYKLSTIYQHVTGNEIGPNAHRAHVDVDATIPILLHPPFWTNQSEYIHKINVDGQITSNFITVAHVPEFNNDSDTDSNSGSSQSSDGSVVSLDVENQPTNQAENQIPTDVEVPLGWQRDTPFQDVDTKAKFDEEFAQRVTRTSPVRCVKIGVVCSVNSVNSPIKAWRSIFKGSISNKIVCYTNKYGDAKSKNWIDISVSDLTDFFAVLFIASIQKCKGRNSNWWSDNPLLENVEIKRIISGKKFHKIM
jgi:Transposase IS4